MATLQNAVQQILMGKQRYLMLHKGDTPTKENLLFTYPVESNDERTGTMLRTEDENELAEALQSYFDGFAPDDMKGNYVLITKVANTAPQKKTFRFSYPDNFQDERNAQKSAVLNRGNNQDFYINELMKVLKESEQQKRELEIKILEFRSEVAVQKLQNELEELKKEKNKDFMSLIENIFEKHGDKIIPVISGIFGQKLGVNTIQGTPQNEPQNFSSDENAEKIIENLRFINDNIGEQKTVQAIEKIAKIVREKPQMVDFILNMNI
jgi:hypothetical protein